MTFSTYLDRFRRLVLLGAVVAAGAFVSTAGAVGRPPDVQDTASSLTASAPDVLERYTALHQSYVARPPDVQDTASSLTASAPDVLERFVATHRDDLGFSSGTASVARPPDVADTALAVQYGSTSTVGSGGFDWGDWAIGIGSGLGLALIVGAAVLMSRQLRHRVQAA